MSEGVETINVIIKHIEDTDTFYADFEPALGTGETLSSVVSATPTDTALTLSSAAVLTVATTDTKTTRDAAGNTTTVTYVIAANKGISFVLTGGTTGAGLSKITAKCLKSTGKTVTRDILVSIKGVDL